MTDRDSGPEPLLPDEDNDAIRHLKVELAAGKPWHIALLGAIGLWTWPEEHHNGRHYCYLIDGEAFDWVLLAERLSLAIAGSVPEDELNALLFFGRLPEEISDEEFRELIGEAKYHAYLNYLYGITIEKFVLIAVEEEIEKERHSQIFSRMDDGQNDAHRRLYDASQEELLRLFQDEKGYDEGEDLSLTRLREFTYWLFKYRLRNCDKARVASDTRKGVEYIKRQRLGEGIAIPQREPPDIIEHGG